MKVKLVAASHDEDDIIKFAKSNNLQIEKSEVEERVWLTYRNLEEAVKHGLHKNIKFDSKIKRCYVTYNTKYFFAEIKDLESFFVSVDESIIVSPPDVIDGFIEFKIYNDYIE